MNSRDLLRQQLDARLEGVHRTPSPKGGWVRTIRRALGMTMAQLGKRLRVSAPAIAELETRESRGTVSVAKLRDAAEAMGCDLVITFVPRIPLTEMVRQQATAKAREEQSRLLHTMKLENQDSGVTQSAGIEKSVERLIAKNIARIWD